MRIKSVELFHTPKNLDELIDWIERHSIEDRAHLWTVAGMTWNLAVSIANKEEKDNDGTPDV